MSVRSKRPFRSMSCAILTVVGNKHCQSQVLNGFCVDGTSIRQINLCLADKFDQPIFKMSPLSWFCPLGIVGSFEKDASKLAQGLFKRLGC